MRCAMGDSSCIVKCQLVTKSKSTRQSRAFQGQKQLPYANRNCYCLDCGETHATKWRAFSLNMLGLRRHSGSGSGESGLSCYCCPDFLSRKPKALTRFLQTEVDHALSNRGPQSGPKVAPHSCQHLSTVWPVKRRLGRAKRKKEEEKKTFLFFVAVSLAELLQLFIYQ